MHHSIAPSSRRVYQTALNHFIRFCNEAGLHIFPIYEDQIIYFAVCSARTFTYKTIKTYIAGIQFHSRISGSHVNISSMHRLYYVLRGIRRVQSQRHHRRRGPITISHLDRLLQFTSIHYPSRDAIMLQSAFSLAFYGMLRVSEYTSPYPHSFDPLQSLLREDISVVSDNIVYVYIKQSKVDVFRFGCTLRVACTKTRHCAVCALRKLLVLHEFRHKPLFMFADGSFLTRSRLSTILARCFGLGDISTHSFRIGGASLAASNGLPDSVIKTLGRWSSDAFLQYLRYDDRSIQGFYE